MNQPETTAQNLKSGQEVAKIEASDPPQRQVAKTHRDYWRDRLERHCYTHDGKLVEVNEWSIRIQYLGRRKSFALGTNNKDVAAVKARDIYLTIVAKGWDAAEASFNPEMVVRKDDPTLGDFLHAVEEKSELKPKTFRNYAGYFRRIVADIFGIDEGKARYAYRDGSRANWLEKVDAVKLSAITPDHITDWKVKYIKNASSNPLDRQSAVRSANSYVRCARSLFSKKWLSRLDMRLPSPSVPRRQGGKEPGSPIQQHHRRKNPIRGCAQGIVQKGPRRVSCFPLGTGRRVTKSGNRRPGMGACQCRQSSDLC